MSLDRTHPRSGYIAPRVAPKKGELSLVLGSNFPAGGEEIRAGAVRFSSRCVGVRVSQSAAASESSRVPLTWARSVGRRTRVEPEKTERFRLFRRVGWPFLRSASPHRESRPKDIHPACQAYSEAPPLPHSRCLPASASRCSAAASPAAAPSAYPSAEAKAATKPAEPASATTPMRRPAKRARKQANPLTNPAMAFARPAVRRSIS